MTRHVERRTPVQARFQSYDKTETDLFSFFPPGAEDETSHAYQDSTVQKICSEAALSELLQSSPAVLLLYGGASCGICQAIRPRLEKLASEEFPKLITVYIDCQETAGPLCAARGIFSLPVVQLWFDGQRFAEFARVFSIGDVRSALERPYGLLL